jgi:hypothetical protein
MSFFGEKETLKLTLLALPKAAACYGVALRRRATFSELARGG